MLAVMNFVFSTDKVLLKRKFIVVGDDIISKQVRTEVPVDGQTVSKYSFVSCTVDSAAAHKSLFYH